MCTSNGTAGSNPALSAILTREVIIDQMLRIAVIALK